MKLSALRAPATSTGSRLPSSHAPPCLLRRPASSIPNFQMPNRQLPSSRLSVVAEVARRKADGFINEPSNSQVATRAASPTELEGSQFTEPLLRNFVLGAGAGILMETAHVLLTAFTAAEGAEGLFMLPSIASSGALAPVFWVDHAVAIGVWALLYFLDASTVSRIIKQHPSDKDSAATEIRNTSTLPKRMLPMSLSNIKRSLFKLLSRKRTTAATATMGASSGPNAFTTGDFARELERRQRGNNNSGGGGTITIERPRTQDPEAPPKEDQEEDAPQHPPAPVPKPNRTNSGNMLRPLQKPAPRVTEPDQQDPQKESKREKELRERKAYLKNFWYAVAISSNLKDKPMEVKMMGRTVVLFRDENGVPKAMENLCAHRGAPLSKGWTKKVDGHNCVVCPYHAWAFDGEGRLADVPTSIQGSLPKRPMQQTYPVEEKGGFVWLFAGSASMPKEERPPIPYIPELDDPNWQAVYAEMEFEAPHWSTFDNALDMAHIHYVHSGSFGNPKKPEILDMKMNRDTFGVNGTFKIHNKPANPLWEWTRVPEVPVDLQAFLPMTSAAKTTLGHGIQQITFINVMPIDEKRSVMRFCLTRNFLTSPALNNLWRKEMYKVLQEDKDIVEYVNPDDLPREVSLAADMPQIAFRKLRQEWVDMGYAVDPATTLGPNGSLNL